MGKYDVRASDGDGSYGSFDSLEAAERALSMVTRRMDPEAQIIVKRDWLDRTQDAEAEGQEWLIALMESRVQRACPDPYVGPPTDCGEIPDGLIEAVCEEAWGIDLRQEPGETRRLFARDAAHIITVVQEWGRES